jgi:cyclin B
MIRANSTRRYAGPEEGKGPADVVKPAGNTTKRRALGDITNAYVADESKDKAAKKASMAAPPAAMAVEQQESTACDVDEPLEEDLDARSYMQRPSDDIDSRDAGNPVLATAYVCEMYDYFISLEKQFALDENYMSKQPYVNERMRCILVDWLVEVHLKFKMVPETLYLTVSTIDRYLEIKQVRRSKLQLVGVAALLVAAKYEEIYPPELRDLVYITDRAYNKQEILEMESDIVNTLKYEFTVPTTHTFLCRYLKAAHADRTMVQLACYLAERSLQEYTSTRFPPSIVAATSVHIARKTLKRHPWSPTLLKYTNYDETDLTECIEDMRVFLSNTASQQQAVFRKYSSPKFGAVAKMALVI